MFDIDSTTAMRVLSVRRRD